MGFPGRDFTCGNFRVGFPGWDFQGLKVGLIDLETGRDKYLSYYVVCNNPSWVGFAWWDFTGGNFRAGFPGWDFQGRISCVGFAGWNFPGGIFGVRFSEWKRQLTAKVCLLFCLVPTPAQSRLEELESDLKDRDEEIKNLKEQSSQIKPVNG